MFDLFVYGTLWFWILCGLEVVLLFGCMEQESGVGATISVLVFGALLQFFGHIDILGFIASHPWQILAGAGFYVACGTVWSIAKWWMFVRDRLEVYNDIKSKWLHGKGHGGEVNIPDDLKADWKKWLAAQYGGYQSNPSKPPLAREHKNDILRWMTFWWVSLTWSFLNDFVKRIFKSIYYRLANQLQSISDRVYAGIKSDF